MAKKIREWPTTCLIDAEGERVLRGAVRVNDAELGVEHDDADRKRIDRSAGSKWESTEGGSHSNAKTRSAFVRRASGGANRTQFGRKGGFKNHI